MVDKTTEKCPFCDAEVPVIFCPSITQIKTARGSGQNAKISSRTHERYEVLSDCPNCKMKKSKIERVLNGGMSVEEARQPKPCKYCGEPAVKKGMCKQCLEFEP